MTITTDIPKQEDIPEKIAYWMALASKIECKDTLPVTFYGEWVPIDDDLDMAMIYLDLWKHFMSKKIDKQPVCEKRIYRPDSINPFMPVEAGDSTFLLKATFSKATLGIKIGFYDPESSPETKP